MHENNSGFKIDESQRQSWLSIAAVWAGGMICVPCLMIGGVLAGGGLSMGEIVASILIGYGLICAYMICIGMQACDTGLPVSVMASGALVGGQIEAVEKETYQVLDANGNWVTDPDHVTLIFTVTTTTPTAEVMTTKVGDQEVRIGKTDYILKSEYIEFSDGTITNVIWGD